MKRFILALCISLSPLPAFTQWQVPLNAVPLGRGPGVSGFTTVLGSSGAGTKCLTDTVPPSFILCSASAATLIIDTTAITGGTINGLLYNHASKVGNLATGNNGVLKTDGSGVPSISSTLPSGMTAPALIITGSLSAAGLVTNAALASPTITINSTSCTLGSSCTVASALTAGSTIVTGGPGVLQNSSSGGTLVSSLNLPSGIVIPSFTVTGTIAGPLGTTGTFISSNNGSNTGFIVQYTSSLTSIGNNFNAPLALLVNNVPQVTIAATTGAVTLVGPLTIPGVSNGGIVYSTASALSVLAGTVTAGQCLLSGSSAAPTWGACAGGAAVASVADSGAGTLTISPTTGSVLAAINLAHANTWTTTGSTTFQPTGATGTTIPATATVFKIFDSSAGSPHTANTPSVGISRYDAITSAGLTGNAPALYVETIAVGAGAGNPNSAAIIGIASQTGKGDIVGVVGNATQSSATAGYVAYPGFFAANATGVGTLAFAIETNTNNGTGVDVAYTNLSPFPSFVGLHVGAGGNLNTAAFWASNNGAQWDVGLAFSSNAVKTATIQDDTNSVTIVKATGTHTNGIDLSGATLTTAYKSNGFNVSGIGVLYTNAFGVGALYGAFGSGINSISGSNNGQFVLAIQNSHGSVGDSGLIIAAGSSTTTDASTSMITFFTSGLGAVVGGITRNGVSSVNYGTSSDERLKTNFSPTKRGLNDLLRIKVEDFNWKEDTAKTVIQGLVAQRLYEIYPYAVHVGGDDPSRNSWQVDYGRLSPLIIQSVQDLEARVRNLEERK